jgi:hypothetical protein
MLPGLRETIVGGTCGSRHHTPDFFSSHIQARNYLYKQRKQSHRTGAGAEG